MDFVCTMKGLLVPSHVRWMGVKYLRRYSKVLLGRAQSGGEKKKGFGGGLLGYSTEQGCSVVKRSGSLERALAFLVWG